MDALAGFAPEAVRILDRARIHVAILGIVDEGALFPVRRNLVNLLRHRIPPSPRVSVAPANRCRRRQAHYATALQQATSRGMSHFGRAAPWSRPIERPKDGLHCDPWRCIVAVQLGWSQRRTACTAPWR